MATEKKSPPKQDLSSEDHEIYHDDDPNHALPAAGQERGEVLKEKA
jgi:hypothetical protein